jgi:Flp pilus assembly pilin Flp
MRNLLKRLMTDESGVSATEYAILLAVVGLAVFTAVGVFSTAMSDMFTKLTADMTSWVS